GHRIRRKVLWNFALPSPARFAVVHKIVADLRSDPDLIPLIRDRLRDQLFAQSVSVRVSRVEQSDAEIKALVHESNRFAFGKVSPPPSGNRPQSEADLANGQVGVFVCPKTHTVS